jgi:uncharacterized protein
LASPRAEPRSLRPLLAVAGVLVTVVGLHVYIGTRLISRPGLMGPVAWAAWTALALLFLSIPLGFIATRAVPRRLSVPIYWISHLWIGAFGLLLTLVVATDLAALVAGAFVTDALSPALRRAQAGTIGVLLAVALVHGIRSARGAARIERVRVPIRDLPPALEGVRIAQITDVHIGETLDRAFLERVVGQVNALDADVVAITGDLVDGSVRRLRDEMTPLSQLRGRHGVFYVTGNHEYYHGGPAWEAEVARLGITVLHNAHRRIDLGGASLVIAGITDVEAGRLGPAHAPDIARALEGAPPDSVRILLAHQPRAAALEKSGHRVDLQLSGHTHGGQIFPFMFFVRLQQPVVRGLHRLHGHWVYTSRGTGYWGPPLRVGPAPEITELTLVRSDS